MSSDCLSRRKFLTTAVAGCALLPHALAAQESKPKPEPIIDVHQHTTYTGRSNQQLIAHQRAMGITTSVLLPAGRMYGLEAGCGGNDSVIEATKEHPQEYIYFANEVADLPDAISTIRKYLKQGAKGIGEQKFYIEADSEYIHRIAELAAEFRVPVLMHFQFATYNTSIERFHKVLEKHPQANFIGHAQTWWANIDQQHDQRTLYPTGKVTPGGITDRLLSDYPNMFGDLSAGSGLNSLLRDEDHTRGFLERHQNKLLYGSDCTDTIGRGPGCQGAQTLAAVRRMVPNKQVERKILYENAKALLKL